MKICAKSTTLLSSALTAGLLAVSGAAHAHGLYFVVGGGQADYTDADVIPQLCATIGIDCPVEDSDTGYRAGMGYQFSPFVAVEGSYTNLGKISADALANSVTANVKVHGAQLAVLPSVPIGKHLSVFGKAGAFAVYLDATAESPPLGLKESADGGAWGFSYGGGVALNLGENATVRVEYERFNIDDKVELDNIEVDVDTNIDFLSANLVFRF